jgi:D-lactate dehydrogenase
VEQEKLWKIRKGLFPSVGAVRAKGTTVIIEDVVFPIEHLADAAVELSHLFVKHGYTKEIIFGHAKDGNLHFVIAQGFNSEVERCQYREFIDDVVDLVVRKYDGALRPSMVPGATWLLSLRQSGARKRIPSCNG